MKLAILTPGNSPHSQPWVDTFTRAGHDVIVYAYPPLNHGFTGATQVREVGGRGPLGRGLWLCRAVKDDSPDVVSMHYLGTDAWILSRLGRPFVVSVWGSDILMDLERGGLKRSLEFSALRKAARIISPARHITRRLRAAGIADESILTAQYGVDATLFAPTRVLGEPPVEVVCTRAFASVYDNETIVRAIALAPDDAVSKIVFAGRGPDEHALKGLASSVKVEDRVSFLGGVEYWEMPALLRSAQVYCSMSLSDGTSLSLLEAMACGLTPVVSDIPANREWVDDGVDGRLVPVGDHEALARALTDVALDRDFRCTALASVRAKVEARGDRSKNMARILSAVEAVADA